MNEEFDLLEARLEQLILMHGRARAENRELLMRVTRLEAENRRLNGKVKAAADKVEAILARLPEA